MKKVSVIIPMYNTEPYIRQCIWSVMSQTFRDLEILVIDDGSTDRSLELCKKCSEADDRIRILSQRNQGVSAARNYGLEEAAGEYVFFLDSDDAIHPLLIEEFVRQADISQADMVFCGYIRLEDRQMEERIHNFPKKDGKICWETAEKQKTEEWFHLRFEKELSCIGGKMIRRDSIEKLRFYERLASGEDTIFLYELCRRQVKMAYAAVEWYYYRIHPESVTHSYDMRKVCQKLKVYERIRDQEYKNGNLAWAMKWEKGLVWNILSVYLVMKNRKDRKGSSFLKKKMVQERKHLLYRKLFVGTRILFAVLFIGSSYFRPFRALWVVKQKISHTYV